MQPKKIWDKSKYYIINHGLHHKNTNIAYLSAAIIGDMKEELATTDLVNYGLNHDDELVVRESARALGEICDHTTLPNLMKISGHADEDTNKAIKTAIKKIQEKNQRK